PAVIVAGALAGVVVLRADPDDERSRLGARGRAGSGLPRSAVLGLVAFAAPLVVLPLARALDGHALASVEAFYRSGALVFGGGNVVLSLLHSATVDPGWVTNADFVAGYGAAQALPGPLFPFAAYLGAVSGPAPNGVLGALLALAAIFLPSFFLVWGLLP